MDVFGLEGLGLGLIDAILAQPEPLRLWVGWLVVVNLLLPLLFINRLEAIVVIAVFVLNGIAMGQLFEVHGFSKILGLTHLVLWPPMMLWLWTRWWGIDSPVMRMWVMLLCVSNFASLAMDAFDVSVFVLNR